MRANRSTTHTAVKACNDCASSTTCIVEDTSTRLNAGSSQLALRICNYKSTTTYTLALSLKSPLACDTTNALVPKVKTLQTVGACSAGSSECAVTAELENPIDWAIVMRNGGDAQAVLATFTSGGSVEVVPIAVSQDLTSAAMQPGDATKIASTSISVCASNVNVSAQRLSRVDGCSTADICRGRATVDACVQPLKTNLPITDVVCSDASCSGKIAVGGILTCADATSGDSTALIVGVKVGATSLSNFAAVGMLKAPATAVSIKDVEDLDVGATTFTVASDSQCQASALQVNVTHAAGDAIAITGINATNGSAVVTLAAPLATTLDGKTLQVTLTQCGVMSKAVEVLVGSDSNDAGNNKQTNGSGSSNATANNAGSESTQETNVHTGLSGGMIVGIAIGVVALLGFTFECWFHKRRQTPPPMSRRPSSSGVMGGSATPLGQHAM